MPRWEALEIDPETVRAEIERGNCDYVEVASQVAETKFFEHLFAETPWNDWVATFPTPRKKEEVPLWLYLSSQLTLRLHGATGYAAYPYVIHCGGLKETLGQGQCQARQDPETHQPRLECQGYNDKNDYARVTPCDFDYLRKMARATEGEALERWFAREVPRYVQASGLWDEEGIVVADGTYLFVPDNQGYERSAVLRSDEHNHPVDGDKLTPKELARTRLRRCYRMVNLIHTNRQQGYWTYAELHMGPGTMAEAPELEPSVSALDAALGRERVKLVIHDRGFIDGPTVRHLKERHIDTLFPLKANMLDWLDAQRLAEADPRPWQVWKPPAPSPTPPPPQRPAAITAREQKRQKTLARQNASRPAPVEVERVEMKLIPEMRLWDTCGVPLQVAVLHEFFTDGTSSAWGLATTRALEDPLEMWQLYELRTAIEERHRQTKCFWDLTHFRSTHYSLIVNRVVFTLLAYTLMQVFLEKTDRGDLTPKTRRRIWEELLPQGDKIVLYAAQRVAFLNAADFADWLLGVSEGARRRPRGRMRQLSRQRRNPPALPPRP